MAMAGLVGTGMEVVDGMHSWQSQGGWSHVGRCRSTCRVRGEDTDDTRSHRRPGAQLWVGLSRNWSFFLERPYHGTPQEGSDSLSMQPVGCTPWCCKTQWFWEWPVKCFHTLFAVSCVCLSGDVENGMRSVITPCLLWAVCPLVMTLRRVWEVLSHLICYNLCNL